MEAENPATTTGKLDGVSNYHADFMHGFSMEDIVRVADAGMYVSKRKGGDRVSTAEEIAGGESAAVRRQQISGYIEGFLQRDTPARKTWTSLLPR